MIRDTQLEDASTLAALVDSVARERRFLAITSGFPAEGTRHFLSSLRSSNSVHVVAVIDGSIVGWCDISRVPFEGMQHVGRLGMGVKAEVRNRGVGKSLLEAALVRASNSGFERIELEVFSSNQKAVRLYESSGFTLEGRKVAARKLDGVVDDILLYAKRVTP